MPPIELILPHRGPMLWLDELVSCEGHDVVCRTTLGAGGERPAVPAHSALMAVELFAQTAGALFGYRGWLSGLPFESGAFVGARGLALHVDRLPLGEPLLVRASEQWSVDSLSLLKCRLEAESGVLAESAITVAVGRPPEEAG